MGEILLETKELTKQFGSHKSNDSISLHIYKGEIYGLVGRNGAGKTTLMKMIANIYTPTSGKIIIGGKEQTPSHHQVMGSLIEEPALIPNLSAYDNIMAKCYLMGVKHPSKHAKELLKLVKLENTRNKHVSHFSLGMRQRVGIALALTGWPEFVLLDEPINGLDPQGIIDVRNIVLQVNKEHGTTFLISSHILGELQKTAGRFGIIAEGKLVKELSESEINIMGRQDIRLVTPMAEKAKEVLNSLEITSDDNDIYIPFKDDNDLITVNKLLVDAGIPVEELYIRHENSEDVFLGLMGGEHYV